MRSSQLFVNIIICLLFPIVLLCGMESTCISDENFNEKNLFIKEIFQNIENQILEKADLNLELSENILYVSIDNQRMYHLDKSGNLIKEYTISTAKKGVNNEEGSFGTPKGFHKISDKIGDAQPLGMVFQSRKPIGKYYWECQDNEFCGITTRIIRLKGLEEGINSGNCLHTQAQHSCDSFDRYIYIHGTRFESKLGAPLSLGCILVKNEDIIKLFDEIPEDSLVYIDPN